MEITVRFLPCATALICQKGLAGTAGGWNFVFCKDENKARMFVHLIIKGDNQC